MFTKAQTARILANPATNALSGLAFGVLMLVTSSGCGPDPAVEQAAYKELQAMKAIVLPDASGHISSLTLTLPNIRERMDEVMPLVDQLPYIQHIDLAGSSITDDQLPFLTNKSNLNSIVLNNTAITDAGVKHLVSIKGKLDTLHLADTKITADSLPMIGRLTNLIVLDIAGTNVGNDFSALRNLENLKWLRLNRLTLPDEIVDVLVDMPGMEKGRLDLERSTISETALQRLKKARPELTLMFGGETTDEHADPAAASGV